MNNKRKKVLETDVEKYLRQKGITLIALIITIIVLLILAGIVISTLFGEDGIISKAVEAGEIWKEAAEKEKAGLETALLDQSENFCKVEGYRIVDSFGMDYVSQGVNFWNDVATGRTYRTKRPSSNRRVLLRCSKYGI